MAEGTETAEAPAPAAAPAPKPHDRRDVDEVVGELVNKYGSERAALRVLADQQLDYRREKRELNAKIPKEGERVLSAAEAKAFDAYTAIGKKPAEIAAALAERDTLEQEATALKSEKVRGEAATLAGFKASVLGKLEKTEGFRTEVRDEKGEDGAPARVPYAIVGEGDAAKAVPLAEYASSALSDFLPSLTAAPPPTGKSSTAPAAPILFPPQAPRGTAPAPSVPSLEQLKEAKRATGAYSA